MAGAVVAVDAEDSIWQERSGNSDAQLTLMLAQRHREACRRSKWDEVNEIALELLEHCQSSSAEDMALCDLRMDSGAVGVQRPDTFWMAASSARSGLLVVTSAFNAHANAEIGTHGPTKDLSLATASSCAALMPDLWPSGAADDLLGMAGIVNALLRVASVHCNGGFAVLRARRAAGELFVALLEAAAPSWRQHIETTLLRDSSHASAMQMLVETLLEGEPDPRLHEVLFEILWRALRRVTSGAALATLVYAHPALAQLESRHAGLCMRVQELGGEDILNNAQELALELNIYDEPPVFMCQLFGMEETLVSAISSHSISLHEVDEKEPLWEMPLEVIKDVSIVANANSQTLVKLQLDVNGVRTLGGFPGASAIPANLECLFEASIEDIQAALANVATSPESDPINAFQSGDDSSLQGVQSNVSTASPAADNLPLPSFGATPSFVFGKYLPEEKATCSKDDYAEEKSGDLPQTNLVHGRRPSQEAEPPACALGDKGARPFTEERQKLSGCNSETTLPPTSLTNVIRSCKQAVAIETPKKLADDDVVFVVESPSRESQGAADLPVASKPMVFRPLGQDAEMTRPLGQDAEMTPPKPSEPTSIGMASAKVQKAGIASPAYDSTLQKNVTQLLGKIFQGQAEKVALPKHSVNVAPKAPMRGYAALSTTTLQALCRARGFNAKASRDELLQQLEVSFKPDETDRQAASRKQVSNQNLNQQKSQMSTHAVAEKRGDQPKHRGRPRKNSTTMPIQEFGLESCPKRQMRTSIQSDGKEKLVADGRAGAQKVYARSPDASPPQDDVTKVIQDAKRLGQEVAKVQEEFEKRKQAAEVATAFLDNILQPQNKRRRVNICSSLPVSQ